MDQQGVNYAFNDAGIDPVTFGVPNWSDGWHKVVIVGSAAKPLSDASKGGRMNFKIRCIEGPEAGKEHFLGLNLYHNDPNTRARAESEMASITHVTGVHAFQNTAQLFNIPFYVLAETKTDDPTPQYPNPKPRTNFRGYKDVYGNEPGVKPAGGQQGGGVPQQAPQFTPQGGAPAYQPSQGPLNNPGGQQFQSNGGQPGFQPGQGGAPSFAPPGGAPGFQPGGQPGFQPGGPAPSFQPPNGQPGFAPPNGQAPVFGAQPMGGPAQAPGFAPPTGFQAPPNGGNAQFPSNGQPAFNPGQPQGQPAFNPGQGGGQPPQFGAPQGAPQWNPQGAPQQQGQPGGWPGQ